MATETKTALLRAAEAAVRAKGFDGFSYADLAAEVGVRTASIHYHFPTKADLSVALMRRYHEVLAAGLAQDAVDCPRASDRLDRVIAQYRAALNEGQSLCLCVAFIGSRESLSETLLTEIEAFRSMVRTALAQVFALGAQDGSIADVADPQDEAAAALALMEGAQLAARAEMAPDLFDRSLTLLRGRLTI